MNRRAVLGLAAGLATSRADESAKADLKLATFNIRFPSEDDGENRWELRRERFFDAWRRLDADLCGVQEAFASQLRDIEGKFPEYRRIGVARDDGKEGGEFSAILWREKRLERLDGGTFWLSDTPEVVGSNTWEAACNRVCTWGRFRDRPSRRCLLVLNSHWDHKSAKAQERTPILLAKEAIRLRKEGDAVVMMGDFNCGPAGAPVRYLLGEKVVLDDKEESSPLRCFDTLTETPIGKRATFHDWTGGQEGQPIDFVLISSDLQASDGRVEHLPKKGRWPSDHHPVSVRVRFRK